MIVPMQHQIGSVSGDHALEDRCIHQPLVSRSIADRRVMNQNDPEKILVLELVEDGSDLSELLRADPSGCEEGCSWHPGRKTDQRDVAATPDKGKAALAVVVAHIRAPLPSG